MIRFDRRKFSASLAGALLVTTGGPALAGIVERKPDIIFIMADDLGYADLSCYGRRD